MRLLTRAALRLVFWLMAGAAVLAVALACLRDVLLRELVVLRSRRRLPAELGDHLASSRAWRDDSSTRWSSSGRA